MGSLLNINYLDNKKDEREQFNSTKSEPSEQTYSLITYIKKIELPLRMQFRILNDGRIGGKEYQNFTDFVILNPEDLSINTRIEFKTQLLNWIQMKNDLLITFREDYYVVNIIKLTSSSKYEIIYSIELPKFGPRAYSFALAESCEGELIIGYPGRSESYYNLLFYEINYNICQLNRKQKIQLKCDSIVSIYPLEGKNMLHKNDTLIFINSKTGQILYNKIFENEIKKIILNYIKDLILLSFSDILYFLNWKNYEIIKTINCGSLDEFGINIYFFKPYLCFNDYIIAERGKMGYGYGQESIKIFKIINNNNGIIDENEIKVFEEMQNLGLKAKSLYFFEKNNMIYIQIDNKKVLVYQINKI